MIYSVNGELVHKDLSMAVIECSGVGYACRTTYSTLSQIGSVGSKVRLLTYLHVREDNIELFGFKTESELNCFKMLISVSGVGPKAALAILSDITPEKFALTIATGDSKTITKTKGVGPKLASRIVLELKDKIAKEQQIISAGEQMDFTVAMKGSNTGEAISALVVLGYTQGDATRAVSKLSPDLSVEELIKQGLKALAAKL